MPERNRNPAFMDDFERALSILNQLLNAGIKETDLIYANYRIFLNSRE
jgi:DNA polymerase III delta subunit